jgi:hypothetical protein
MRRQSRETNHPASSGLMVEIAGMTFNARPRLSFRDRATRELGWHPGFWAIGKANFTPCR